MKKPNHYFVLVNPRSNSRVRQVRIHSVSIYLLLFCLFAGTIGFSRMLWFSASFGLGKIGLHNERCENDGLKAKIDFFDRFLVRESMVLDSMVTFEDRLRLTYGMNSISTDVRKAGIGGAPSIAERKDAADTDPLLKKSVAMQEGLSILLRRVQLQNTTLEETGGYVARLYKLWSQSPSIRPASGTVTSGFGYRTDPMSGETMFHDGLDIANQIGTPVFAPADGIVRATGVMQDFGNAVIIQHPESKVETIYGHLNQFTVQAFQGIRRGELIGYVGNSGKSTGPHLHYEIRKNGSAISPVPFILPPDQIAD